MSTRHDPWSRQRQAALFVIVAVSTTLATMTVIGMLPSSRSDDIPRYHYDCAYVRSVLSQGWVLQGHNHRWYDNHCR